MTIPQETIDRVDRIHAALDEASRRGWLTLVTDSVAFDADEVRQWPALKAAMIQAIANCDAADYARPEDCPSGVSTGSCLERLREYGPESLARGLVMFRGSRAFKEHQVKLVGNPTVPGTWFDRVTKPIETVHSGPTAAQVREAYAPHVKMWDIVPKEMPDNSNDVPITGRLSLEPAVYESVVVPLVSESELARIVGYLERRFLEKPDPKCACGASLVTSAKRGSDGRLPDRCSECVASNWDHVGMGLTRGPAFPDASRPAVPIAEQAHPLGHFGGRVRRYR